MIKVEAIVRPEKLDEVLKALEKVGYSGVMITEIQGHGKQKGVTQLWRGERFRVELLPKMKLEVVAPDAEAPRLAQAISEAARTGEIGDGKIFLSHVDYCQRIRTGETGEAAL
jgi:nitrogen regulatory protein P-II 1